MQVVADLKNNSEGENIINLKVKNLPEKIEAVVDPATIDVTLSKKVTNHSQSNQNCWWDQIKR
mgnify:CR=1 FL=1